MSGRPSGLRVPGQPRSPVALAGFGPSTRQERGDPLLGQNILPAQAGNGRGRHHVPRDSDAAGGRKEADSRHVSQGPLADAKNGVRWKITLWMRHCLIRGERMGRGAGERSRASRSASVNASRAVATAVDGVVVIGAPPGIAEATWTLPGPTAASATDEQANVSRVRWRDDTTRLPERL